MAGAKIGESTHIARGVCIDFPWRLSIGNKCNISSGVYLDCRGGPIIIGNSVNISMDAIIYTATHDIFSKDFKVKFGNIKIENFSWICARSILLPGSNILKGSILAANSVFRGCSQEYTLYRGNPAHEIKKLPSYRAIDT